MAKNFTDFQEVTGNYTPAVYPGGDPGGYLTGTTETGATSSMYLVGYNTDDPHGERRYTIESVLLAAESYHVGLENVENISVSTMFDNSTFTGHTTADDLTVKNNLYVLGDRTELSTKSFATSAFNITNHGTTTALKVVQEGSENVATFWDGDEIALDIDEGPAVGINRAADSNWGLVIKGSVSADGPLMTLHHVNNRDMIQDGYKLDRIQGWADVTGLSLSGVKARLEWLKDNSDQYTDCVPDEAFDLLEDGSDYKKVPALSSTNATYSIEKIQSVEDGADVTGDHSADIILNDVPDGPWTGNRGSTFVRVTSADRDRLTTIRGVVSGLYNGDTWTGGSYPRDIDQQDIKEAYHEAYPWFWSQSDDDEYRNTIQPAVCATYTDLVSVSARRDDVITKVETTSANWDENYTDYTNTKSRRDDVITKVETTSANWDENYSDYTNTKSRRDAVITKVETTSGNWDNTHNKVLSDGPKWDSTYTTVKGTSSTWVGAVNNIGGADLADGHADLSNVTITTELKTEGDTYISGNTFALTANDAGTPEWIQGLTETVDVGGTILQFIDGIVVASYPDPNGGS